MLFGLGVWQLQRAAQKAQIQAQFDAKSAAPPVELNAMVNRIAPSDEFLRVSANGRYLAEQTLLLDNRTYRGRVGYHVVTPFVLADSGIWVLINRGWVEGGYDRSQLPRVPTRTGPVSLVGRLRSAPSKPFMLPPQEWDSWPSRVQHLDLEKLSQLADARIVPLLIYLDQGQEPGLIQEWPVTNMGPARHHGYAVQWFALAIATVLYFLVTGSSRVTRRARRQ